MESKCVVESINEAKSWYFKIVNKINKTLVSWSRKKWESTTSQYQK